MQIQFILCTRLLAFGPRDDRPLRQSTLLLGQSGKAQLDDPFIFGLETLIVHFAWTHLAAYESSSLSFPNAGRSARNSPA